MPALQPVANHVKAQLHWTDGSDTGVTTSLYYRYTGGAPDVADCLSLASDIFTAAGNLANLCHESRVLTGCRVTDLSTDTGGDATHSGTTTGALTGDLVPASACVLINFSIPRRYRGGKPRIYIPGGDSETMETAQQWTSGFVTSATGSWSAFNNAVVGSSSGTTDLVSHASISYYEFFTATKNPVTGRYKNTPNPRTPPLPSDITTFSVNSRIASQRRRNGR